MANNFGFQPFNVFAYGRITSGGAVVAGFVAGDFTPATTGTGVYTITIPAGIAPAVGYAVLNDATDGEITCVNTSATVFTISTFTNAGAPANRAFSFFIVQVPTTL